MKTMKWKVKVRATVFFTTTAKSVDAQKTHLNDVRYNFSHRVSHNKLDANNKM